MPTTVDLHIAPELLQDDDSILEALSKKTGISKSDITGINILKRSIDARKKPIKYFLRIEYFVDEPFVKKTLEFNSIKQIPSTAKTVIIIGMGPAGMFAALECLKQGLKPVILERGKPVNERRRDLAQITKFHKVNPESNYCFGEGGAGTYSDGKLYTRSKKRGDLNAVLNILVQYGANPDILVDAHPHIGTNKLPKIIEAIRMAILNLGGTIHFNTKVTDIIVDKGQIKGVLVNDAEEFIADHVILATGHSARDIFNLLLRRKILIEAKPFALGVRVEHPQTIIDQIQYKSNSRGPYLPPASYQLVQQAKGLGVYSFCMCPGGIIAPCATDQQEVVTNGWSPSKRDNPYANSGLVVEIPLTQMDTAKYGALAGIQFQKTIEHKAWIAGGKTQTVPAQRLVDFTRGKVSNILPKTSYIPGITSVNLHNILPNFVAGALSDGLKAFGRKMPAYFTNEATLHAVESRTSSPVRIPREKESLQHPEVSGLYPCGEGAGYAGGIISAAIDGMRCAKAIASITDL